MKNKKQNMRQGFLLITLGLLLITAALFLAAYNVYDDYRATQSAKRAIDQLEEYIQAASEEAAAPADELPYELPMTEAGEVEIPNYILNPNMDMSVKTINGIGFIGVLRIPSLELELPIISQWSYPNLKTAPCRYSGSAYLNNLVICGHNYTSHFGSLKKLWEGDTITFTDMDGNVFTYQVVERETLQPTAIEEMEAGDWDLTLFTCTVGGQSRVTVRCVLEEAD